MELLQIVFKRLCAAAISDWPIYSCSGYATGVASCQSGSILVWGLYNWYYPFASPLQVLRGRRPLEAGAFAGMLLCMWYCFMLLLE
jgi:hypothetical protein